MRCFGFLISIFFSCITLAQKPVKGLIVDHNNEPIENVMITDKNKILLTLTHSDGSFSISTKIDSILCFSRTGYLDTCININSLFNKKIILIEKKIYAKEVVVSSNKNNRTINSVQTGLFEIKTDSLRNLPTILGESDPMKLMQLTPGVSKTDFNMGLNVRGSTTDQNLVMIDDAVIYNPTHLAGFLSVFNPLIVEKLSLIKSGIPAEYGGRLSSITLVETDKNLVDQTHFESNTGILLSGFALKTPLKKDKVSISISGRKSYIDQTIKPISRILFRNQSSMFNSSFYGFYDLNAGIIIKPSIKDMIYINAYGGNDDFKLIKTSFNLDYKMNWSNQAYSIKWLHHFHSNHIMKTVVYKSKGDFGIFFGQNDFNFSLNSSISDLGINHEHSFFFNKLNIKTGVSALKQTILPNKSKAELIDFQANFGTPNVFNTLTLSAYVQSEYEFTSAISSSIGIRFNNYNHFGSFQRYIRSDGINISDTVFYKENETVKNYQNWEPRFAIRILLNNTSSIKLSATRNIQYLQQINVSSVSLPTDFWMPASYQLKPQDGIQLSIGYYKNITDDYSFVSELFYKHANNLTEFKKGILSTVTKAAMEENIITGTGRAYGIELTFEKKIGSFTGWISYTLSRSERIFQEINNGKAFPAKYDRTHDLSIVSQYKINEKWSSSAVFILASGAAVTLPVGRYMVGQNIVNQYSEYNSFRMPVYHRLDLSFTRKFSKIKNMEHDISFGLYNSYSRLNPFFMYFSVTGDIEKYKLKVHPKFVSIFPVLPFVTYHFQF